VPLLACCILRDLSARPSTTLEKHCPGSLPWHCVGPGFPSNKLCWLPPFVPPSADLSLVRGMACRQVSPGATVEAVAEHCPLLTRLCCQPRKRSGLFDVWDQDTGERARRVIILRDSQPNELLQTTRNLLFARQTAV
jgi:hypothetical protein